MASSIVAEEHDSKSEIEENQFEVCNSKAQTAQQAHSFTKNFDRKRIRNYDSKTHQVHIPAFTQTIAPEILSLAFIDVKTWGSKLFFREFSRMKCLLHHLETSVSSFGQSIADQLLLQIKLYKPEIDWKVEICCYLRDEISKSCESYQFRRNSRYLKRLTC